MDLSVAMIAFSLVILFSYLATMLTSRVKVPAVVLLLGVGILAKVVAGWTGLVVPDLKDLINVLGTVGLILIVLEASLEIRVTQKNLSTVVGALVAAVSIVGVTSFLLSFVLANYLGFSGKAALLGSIALSIMSSAIVIPSVAGFNERTKLFLTLESAFSDVIGVVLFNFVLQHDAFGMAEVGLYLGEIGLMVAVSLVAVVGLATLLKVNKSKVRYFLILAFLLLLYGIGKYYHLPILVLILVFGLVLANFDSIKKRLPVPALRGVSLGDETRKFEEMNNEVSFIVRTFFFVVFGSQLNLEVLGSWTTLVAGASLLLVLYLSRALVLVPLSRHKIVRTVLTAPRGLITILLFYQIEFGPGGSRLSDLMYVCVIGSILIMTVAVLLARDPKPAVSPNP